MAQPKLHLLPVLLVMLLAMAEASRLLSDSQSPPNSQSPPESKSPPKSESPPESKSPPQSESPPPESKSPPESQSPPESKSPPQFKSPPESKSPPPQSNSPPPKSKSPPPESNSPPESKSPPESNSPPESKSPPEFKSPPPESNSPPHSETPPISPTPPTPTTPPPTSSPPPPSTPSHSPPPKTTPTPPPTTSTPPPSPTTTPTPPKTSTPPPSPTSPPLPPSSPSPPPPTTTPSPSPPSSTPPTSTPSSPSPPTSSTPPTPPSSSPKTARCKNKYYPQCYNVVHVCPSSCPGGCEVDCVTCKPVCKCDRPGAVCQDPRFIGGDGITFYFHGKKDRDFCLVSDSNLHINAHFIGRQNENMKRDFTWVQSIAIMFDKHQLFIGALKTSTWDDSVDRLAITVDGETVTLLETEGARWQSTNIPKVSISRVGDTNNVEVEVEGKFIITAKVVPITEEDSRIHNYGITKEDCFAHLDLGFKFYTLSNEVTGVLGQTYKPDYVSRVNIRASMPVMGGDREFETSSLFAADCAVARFNGSNGFDSKGSLYGLELPSMRCASGIDGQGVVCKR